MQVGCRFRGFLGCLTQIRVEKQCKPHWRPFRQKKWRSMLPPFLQFGCKAQCSQVGCHFNGSKGCLTRFRVEKRCTPHWKSARQENGMSKSPPFLQFGCKAQYSQVGCHFNGSKECLTRFWVEKRCIPHRRSARQETGMVKLEVTMTFIIPTQVIFSVVYIIFQV